MADGYVDILICLALLVIPNLILLVLLRSQGLRVEIASTLSPAAVERAAQLLQEVMPEDQLAELDANGHFSIKSPNHPGREYRVWSTVRPVDVYESGKLTMSLCVESLDPLPPGDVMLVHKLMIEGNEKEYLRVANQLSAGVPQRGWRRGWPTVLMF